MRTHVNRTFQLKPLAVAVGLALGLPLVVQGAPPSPSQMPGGGVVANGNVAASAGTTTGGGAGTTITGIASGVTLKVTGNSVVTWGSSTGVAAEPPAPLGNSGGFNIGSSATLNVTSAAGRVALLNVDVSGSNSQIFGTLADTSTAGGVAVFVANRNGVIIGPTAKIALGGGFGALGVNLEATSAQNDFVVGNLDLNMQGAAPVTIQSGAQIAKDISGVVTGSNPTGAAPTGTTANSFVLLAGSNVTNAGQILTQSFDVDAGQVTNTGTPTVGLRTAYTPGSQDVTVPGTVSLFGGGKDTGAYTAAPGSFTNSGSVNSSNTDLLLYVNGPVDNSGTLSAGGATQPQAIRSVSTGFTNESSGTLAANILDIKAGTGDVTLGGQVTAFAGAPSLTNRVKSLAVTTTGNVSINTPITVANSGTGDFYDAAYFVRGNSVSITAAQTVSPDPGGSSSGDLRMAVNNPLQQIALTSTGSLNAGDVLLGGYDGLDQPNVTVQGNITATNNVVFRGNNFGGDPTGKATITTPNFYAITTGNVNNPVSTSNWLANGVNLTSSNVTVVANGAGLQYLNLKINGDATVHSGTANVSSPATGALIVPPSSTTTAFGGTGKGRPITTGTTAAGNLVANGGSHLILNATGSIVVSNDTNPGSGGGFNFPGQLVFEAGKTVTTNAIVDNAWTPVAPSGNGVYFDAPTIVTNAYIATNGNSWVNFSQKPVSGIPTIYQFQQPNSATLVFTNATLVAPHQNSYKAVYIDQPPTPINYTVLQ